MSVETLRIDVLLWHLRLAPSRSVAQARCLAGHMRINGRRVEKPSTPVRSGDVLTLPDPRHVDRDTLVITVTALPHRRGPASEAQALYVVHPPVATSAPASANG